MSRQLRLTPAHKLPAFALIIRATHANGADDQRAVLNEMYRRGLWLGPDQRRAALASGGWVFRPVTFANGGDGPPAHGWEASRGIHSAGSDENRDALEDFALKLSGYDVAPTPLDARPPLPVIFRADRSGDFKGSITAVFPTLPGTNDPHTATCYAHIGQHSSCDWEWYRKTRAATPAEFAPLLAELRGIYERDDDPEAVRLIIAKRWTRHHDKARRANLRATGRAA